MGSRSKRGAKQSGKYNHGDPDIREVKYILLGVGLALLFLIGSATIGQAQPLQFLDGIIQYAEATTEHIINIHPDAYQVGHTDTTTSTACPVPTTPTSGFKTTGDEIVYERSDVAGSCEFTILEMSEASDTAPMLPKFLEQFLSVGAGMRQYMLIQDFSETNTGIPCRLWHVSSFAEWSEYNYTQQIFSIVDNSNDPASGSSSWSRCGDGNAQRPQLSHRGSADYLEALQFNRTVIQWGLAGTSFTSSRESGLDHGINFAVNPGVIFGLQMDIPANNTAPYWFVQEHPKFDDNPGLSDSFVGIDPGSGSATTFTMDSGLAVGERGQIVVFKEFNKTTDGVDGSGIRVTGGIESITDSSDLWLRFEVKDGGYGLGSTGDDQLPSGNFEEGFNPNEYEVYKNGGSLGVVHLEPDASAGVAKAFDITLDPNWANSTSDTVTVFIGIDDNSTAGSLIANITGFEIADSVAHDFEDINDLRFWESHGGDEATGTFGFSSPMHRALDNDYDQAYLNMTNVATSSFTGDAPPAPSAVTSLVVTLDHYDTIGLTWNHDILNSTGYVIERDDGSGFVTIANLFTPLFQSFTDANQLDLTRASTNLVEDAKGLEENTTYTYRVTVLNGVTESTPVTSSSITTPDDDDFWQLKEHDAETAGNFPIFDFNSLGGDTADWFQFDDETQLLGGRNAGFLMKTFNMTELGVTNETDLIFYHDGGCLNGDSFCPSGSLIRFIAGDYNRYNSTIFPTNGLAVAPVQGGSVIWIGQAYMGDGLVFEPGLTRISPNWDFYKATSDLVTMSITWDELGAEGHWDFKNFTISNSTTWNMQNSLINYTSNITNCNIQDNTFPQDNNIEDCDKGSVLFSSSPHSADIKQDVNATSDWQFRERKDRFPSNGHSFITFESNATGFKIVSTDPQTSTDDFPPNGGFGSLFKTFTPTSSTTTIESFVSSQLGTETAGILVDIKVCEESLDRWNGLQFETQITNFPVCTNVDQVTAIHTVGVTPPGTISLEADTSGFIGQEITAMFLVRDRVQNDDGQVLFHNATIGGTIYDFSNPTLKHEIENTRGGDRGLLTPSSLVIQEVPPAPTGVTATAVIEDVLVEWNSTEAFPEVDTYFVERGSAINGTWEFREANEAGGGSTPNCLFTSSSGSDGGVLFGQTGSSVSSDACYIWKKFPTTFLNNTNVEIDWTGFFTPTALDTGNSRVYYTNFDVIDRKSIGYLGTNGILINSQLIQNQLVKANDPTGWTRTFDSYIPTPSEFVDEMNTDDDEFTYLAISVADPVEILDNPTTRIHTINITDNTTGEQKAFFNFSGAVKTSENTGSCQDFGGNQFDCDYGLFDIDESDFTINDFEVIGTSNNFFFDDFTTDNGWSSANPTNIFLDTNLGQVNFTDITTAALDVRMALDLENEVGIINQDTYTIRSKVVIEAEDANNSYLTLLGISEDDEVGLTGEECHDNFPEQVGVTGDKHCATVSITLDDWQMRQWNNTEFQNRNLNLTTLISAPVTIFTQTVSDGVDIRTTMFTDENFSIPFGDGFAGKGTDGISNLDAGARFDAIKYLHIGGSPFSFTSTGFGMSGYYDWILFANGVNLTGAVTSGGQFFLDTTVERATDYSYRVFANNTIGNGTNSDPANVLTNDIPAQVTGLTALRPIPTQIDLSWDQLPDDSGVGFPSSGVNLTKYQIFRSENGGAFTLVGENPRQSPPAIIFNDTSVNALFFYSYEISACNELGCGTNSSSFFVASPPTPPGALTATADLADVLLDWFGGSISLNDDFNTDDWIQAATQVDINTVDEDMDFDTQVDTFTHSEYFDFGTPLGDIWTLRFDINIDSLTLVTGAPTLHDSQLWIGLADEDGTFAGSSTVAQDLVAFEIKVNTTDSAYSTCVSDEVAMSSCTTNDFTTIPTGTDNYSIEVSRTGDTTGEIKLYTQGFTNLLETKSITGLSSTVDDLQYLKVQTRSVGTVTTSGGVIGTVDNVLLGIPEVVDDYRIERLSGGGFNITSLESVANHTFTGNLTLQTEGIFFRDDGKKMYVTVNQAFPLSDWIDEFTLTEAWNPSTAVWQYSFNTDAENSVIQDLHFKPDGTVMAVQFITDDELNYYSLSTGWDISTATHIDGYDSDGDTTPRGIYVRPDGLMYWTTGTTADRIIESTLGVAWDFSTANTQTQILDTTADDVFNPETLEFNDDGTIMIVYHREDTNSENAISRYELSTPYDVSTALINSTVSLEQLATDETTTEGMHIKPGGLTIFTLGNSLDEMKEWKLTADQSQYEIIVPSLVENAPLAGATFFEDFSTDQGWLIKNETAMTLNTDLGRLEFNDLHSGAAGVGDLTVGTRASLPLVDILGEGIGNTWSVRGKVVITEMDDNPAVNTTQHLSHHGVTLGLVAITSENATHFNADACDSVTGGPECVTLRTRSFLGDWQLDVQNVTTSTGVEANLGLNTFLNVDEYYFEIIKQTATTQSAIYIDDQFSIPLTDNATGLPLFRVTLPNTAIDYSQIQHLLFGSLINQGSNCGVHDTYTGCTFGAKGYWDYVAFWNNINTTETLPTSYRDTDVELATNYVYRVTALNNTIPSEPSNEASVLTNDLPAQVVGTSAEFNGPSQVDIDWTDLDFDSGIGSPSTGLNLTKYKVFRQNLTSGDPFVLAAEVLATSPPPNFFNDTGVSFPSTFSYQISGCNDIGCGTNSSSAASLVTSPPDAPQNVIAIAVNATVDLDWDDADFALNYTVQRRNDTASESTFTTIATGVIGSAYIDTGVSEDHDFTYLIYSVNNIGNATEQLPENQPTVDDLAAYYQMNTDDIVNSGVNGYSAPVIQNLGTLGEYADMVYVCTVSACDMNLPSRGASYQGPDSPVGNGDVDALVPGLIGEAGWNNGTNSITGTRWNLGNTTGAGDDVLGYQFLRDYTLTNKTTINFWIKDPNSQGLGATDTVTPLFANGKFGSYSLVAGFRLFATGFPGTWDVFSDGVAGGINWDTGANDDWHMITIRVDHANQSMPLPSAAVSICIDFPVGPCNDFSSGQGTNLIGGAKPTATAVISFGQDGCSGGSCKGRTFMHDEVAIWSNSVLSSSELTYLYNGGAGVELILSGAGLSESNQVTTNTVPTEPLNLTGAMGLVIPDLEDVFLEWDEELDNGTGSPSTGVPIIDYTIERKQGIGAFSFLANVSGGIFEYEDESTVPGANYTWWVKGTNILGMSPFSNTFSLIVSPLMAPEAPTDLTATTLSGTEIQLDWLEAVSGDPATIYFIQERHVGFGGFVTIGNVSAPTLTFTSTGLLSSNTYDYQVRADNGAGSSPYSNIATNTTFGVPTAPENLTATTLSDTSIFLDWDEPEFTNGGIIQYNIERESPISGGFSLLTTLGGGLFGGDFTDDFSSYPDNATADLTWENSDCSPGSYCGVNATSDSIRTHFGNPDTSGISYDIFSNLGINATNLDGEGTFQLLFDVTLEDGEGSGGNNIVIGIGSEDFTSGTLNPEDFLGVRHLENAGVGSANQFVTFMADGGTLSSVDIDSDIGGQGIFDSTGIPRYMNVTFDGTDLFINYHTCLERTPACFLDSLQSNDGPETYRELRYVKILPLDSGGSGAQHKFELDNFALSINGTTPITLGTISITEYTDIGLTPMTQYNYRVNATNFIGSSPYSNQAANTTWGVASEPINLNFVTNGISEITVSWDEPLNDFGSAVTGYRIDQAEGIGGTFITAIANTGNNIEPLEELFAGLLQQTNYVYRIAAINGFGQGAYSANLTAGTFLGPSPPENFFVIFNATKPYSTFMSWETPLSDGGKPLSGYLVERKDIGGTFQLIANITSPLILNFTDNNLLQLAEHEYRVAAYSNPTGTFTSGQPVATVVTPNFQNFVINDFQVVGDVLSQQYSITIDDCFPACTLTQADIIRNGITEANFAVGEPISLDTELNFTSHFIIIQSGTQFINTSAVVTNLGSTNNNETGVVTTSLQFVVDTLAFNHSRNTAFDKLNFDLVRKPIPWSAECQLRGGQPSLNEQIINIPFGGTIVFPGTTLLDPSAVTATLSLQGVGTYSTPPQFNVIPARNAYMSCEDPVGTQILAFTSFGTGNGTLALTGFTDQLGTFLGVPVPFIFIIILAAIWTGRSASTGIIFLAVAIGSLGVLGYFDPVSGSPTGSGEGDGALAYFWGFIVFLTLIGVFLGKRFF